MALEGKKCGKIVFVSSTLGYMSFLGYSSYSPAKHALRGEFLFSINFAQKKRYSWLGLADTLQSELMLYEIDVHIFFPPTIYNTPGYEQENKTKPAIVLEIESTDKGLTSDQAAQALFNGVVSCCIFDYLLILRIHFRCGKRAGSYYWRLSHQFVSSFNKGRYLL